jgi:hypothetical protein
MIYKLFPTKVKITDTNRMSGGLLQEMGEDMVFIFEKKGEI